MVTRILENMNKVIVGKEMVSKLILTAMLAGGHVLLEDVPGVGKTTFANSLARTIDCSFSRIQFTPDTMPSDITGSSVYNFEKHIFEYVEGALMSNIVLADEINRTSPKTQASLHLSYTIPFIAGIYKFSGRKSALYAFFHDGGSYDAVCCVHILCVFYDQDISDSPGENHHQKGVRPLSG